MKQCPFLKKECIETECGIWTKAPIRDEQPGIKDFKEGCAISLIAEVLDTGYIPTGKLLWKLLYRLTEA